jgi:hypothetical protein
MIVGRPLRFLGVTFGGWIALRVTILWWPVPDVLPPELPERAQGAAEMAIVRQYVRPVPLPSIRPVLPNPVAKDTIRIDRDMVEETEPTPAVVERAEPMQVIPASFPVVGGRRNDNRSRFGGSFWLVARGGNAPVAGVLAPQLGGAQAGARFTYALGTSRRLALAARISSPLGPGAQELALGLDWRPTRLPIRVIAEHRIALNGGRGGPTVGLVGGFGPRRIAGGIVADGYAQGGVIARDGGEGFADGAVRVGHPVGALGNVRFDLGAATWGAVQRGASRVDLGPSLVVQMPLGRQPVRMSLDWRHRVAGNAAPNSGLVLTLGADF